MVILQKKLITIEVIYYRPDYRSLLQSFVWQTDDFVPELPRIHKFLHYWHANIEAIIREVLVAEASGQFRPIDFHRILNDH